MEVKTIGFIGTGVMGRSMAGHLIDAGFKLKVYNRTKEKASSLIDKGALWASSPKEAAENCDVVISIVGYPADVKEVWLGDNGAIQAMKPGAIGIDMTSSIYYSFFILSTVIGFELLYEDKKLTEIPKNQYLLGVVVIPVLVGWMLHSN